MIMKVEELSSEQRYAAKLLLGREVSDAESISVRAFVPRVPTESERQAASEEIRRLLDTPSPSRAKVSEEEFEAAFLEAMRSVRPNFTPVP